MPESLASVSSLLLFNSTQNPYKKYSTLDTLVGTAGEPEPEVQEEDKPGGAPTSVAERFGYEGLGKSDISYQPGAAPLTQFNLAPNLDFGPDSAPIANNVAFNSEVVTIAPSHFIGNLDLRQIELPSVALPPVSAAPTAAAAPPPPPPPPGQCP